MLSMLERISDIQHLRYVEVGNGTTSDWNHVANRQITNSVTRPAKLAPVDKTLSDRAVILYSARKQLSVGLPKCCVNKSNTYNGKEHF